MTATLTIISASKRSVVATTRGVCVRTGKRIRLLCALPNRLARLARRRHADRSGAAGRAFPYLEFRLLPQRFLLLTWASGCPDIFSTALISTAQARIDATFIDADVGRARCADKAGAPTTASYYAFQKARR